MKILVQGALGGAACEQGDVDAWGSLGLSSRDLTVLEEEITRLERLIQSFRAGSNWWRLQGRYTRRLMPDNFGRCC
jgi:hypothetical protein